MPVNAASVYSPGEHQTELMLVGQETRHPAAGDQPEPGWLPECLGVPGRERGGYPPGFLGRANSVAVSTENLR
jgi:hypothetical protein